MKKQALDARGLLCPLPVLKAAKLLRLMNHGDILDVMATDPASKEDFKNFCITKGCELIKNSNINGILHYQIKK